MMSPVVVGYRNFTDTVDAWTQGQKCTPSSRLRVSLTRPSEQYAPGVLSRVMMMTFRAMMRVANGPRHDDDDVYYRRGRRPREDEQEEDSYEKQRQRP